MASLKGSKGKKRCTKGKSCGATCIVKSKVCRKDLKPEVSSSTARLKEELEKLGTKLANIFIKGSPN